MKKTLALLLSLTLVLVAFFAMTISSSAAAATTVTVTKADDSATVLDATTKTVAGATGTVTFDATTGKVTLDGVTGIKKIVTDTGALIVEVKGTNTLENAGADNCIYVNAAGGDITIQGDGTLNLTANAYVVTAQQGNITLAGSVKMNVTSTTGAAIHTAANSGKGVITVKDSVFLTINSVGHGLYTSGEQVAVNIQDNAKVDITNTAGDSIQAFAGSDNTEVTGTPSATIKISGKANVKMNSKNCCIRTNVKDLDKGTSNIVITDDAVVDATSSGQTIYANGEGTNSATNIEISGKANVTAKNTGKYAAIQLNGKTSNNLKITTTGTVTATAANTGWLATIYTSAAKNTVLFKDATINVSNICALTDSEVVMAIWFQSASGSGSTFDIMGSAKVTLNAENNSASTAKTCRAYGIYSTYMTTTIGENAKLTASASGNAKASWGGGAIHFESADMVAKDNAYVSAKSSGNPCYSLGFSVTSSCKIQDNAYVEAISQDGYAMKAYGSGSCKLDITGGTLLLQGPKGIKTLDNGNVIDETITASGKQVKTILMGADAASAEAAEKISATAKYGKITVLVPGAAPNPGTSDLAIAAISSVAVLAVLAAAAVVIRKRVNG